MALPCMTIGENPIVYMEVEDIEKREEAISKLKAATKNIANYTSYSTPMGGFMLLLWQKGIVQPS